MNMNSKQRVHATILRQPVDHTPMWMWYHPEIYIRLKDKFGWDPDQADAELGSDIKQVHISINREMFRPLARGEEFTDEWGVTWTRAGWYNQVCRNPLASADSRALADYRFPNPDDPERFAPLAKLCDQYADDFFIGADVSGSIFEPCYHIRGMENLMVDMVEDLRSVETFFDNAMEFTRRVCERALDYPIDWVWLGDDVGGQSSMMMSPNMWRAILKPRMATIIRAIKSKRPKVWVAYHTCGSVDLIVPDLIEIGIDVLNPIQPLCPGMEPKSLKRRFGDSIAFFGGLDTQELLVNETADQVFRQSCELIRAMSAGGGYIFGASHTIQPDVPLDNVLVLRKASREC